MEVCAPFLVKDHSPQKPQDVIFVVNFLLRDKADNIITIQQSWQRD
jgi:hypothetical protein